jgi:hypothetical protein
VSRFANGAQFHILSGVSKYIFYFFLNSSILKPFNKWSSLAMKAFFAQPFRFFLFTLILIVYPLVNFAAESISTQPPVAGLVVWVTGTMKAMMPGSSVRTLSRRSPIYESDTVITDSRSSGEIVFADNSILSLRNSTTMEISKYHFNKTSKTGNSETLNLIKGGFRTITGAITKEDPQSYKVNTPVATIGVAGTVYSAYFDAHARDLFTKLDAGIVFISNDQGKITLSKQAAGSGSGCNIDTYSAVSGDNKPQVVCNQPGIFASDPPVIPVNFPSNNKAPGSVGSFCVS